MNLICRSESIMYLGWKSSEELHEYLAACDIYMQPGGQSVTMQNALCCGAALAVYPHKSHKFLLGDSVFYIKDVDDMVELFNQVSRNRELITEKRALSYKLACEKLNYKIIASRLYK